MNLGAIQERARAGDVRAQAELGHRFATGKGVRRDYRKAAYWDQLAADRGDASAQYSLAQSCFSGRGVEKDVERALDLFGRVWANPRADDHLRAEAAINLGWSARNGENGADRGTARTWYQRASRLGHASGFYNLGLLEAEEGQLEKAARYFRLGAALGHHKAMYELARLHVDRELIRADSQLATELLRAAARTVPRARRLLNSKRLAEMRRGAAERTADRTPDARFDGTWALRDSDAWYEIEVGVAGSTKIRCCDPQESFAVSDIAWRDGELCFVTLCPSTQWRIENRLLRIDGETLLVVRRGDSYEPTTARRQRRASAREGMQNER